MLMGTPHKVPWRHATLTATVNTWDDHRHFSILSQPSSSTRLEMCDSLDVSRKIDIKYEYICSHPYFKVFSNQFNRFLTGPIKGSFKEKNMPLVSLDQNVTPEVAGYLWLRFEESSRKKAPGKFLCFTRKLRLFTKDPLILCFTACPTKAASKYRIYRMKVWDEKNRSSNHSHQEKS